MRGNFNEGKRFERVFGAAAGVTSDNTVTNNGDQVDLQGFRSITAIVALGAQAAGSEASLKWQHRDSTTATWEDVPGSTVSIADDDDDQVIVMSYERSDSRYVRLAYTRDGSNNSAIGGAVYISHLARDTDIAQPADVHSVNQVNG